MALTIPTHLEPGLGQFGESSHPTQLLQVSDPRYSSVAIVEIVGTHLIEQRSQLSGQGPDVPGQDRVTVAGPELGILDVVDQLVRQDGLI